MPRPVTLPPITIPAGPVSLPHATDLPSTPHFPDCGAGNCDSHPYELEYIDPFQLRSGVSPSEFTGNCEGCHSHKPLSQLHRLPCKHALCHACLVMLARQVSGYILTNLPAILTYADFATQETKAANICPLPHVAGIKRRDAALHRALAAGLAGLTCCGVDTSICIGGYMGCLPPMEAYNVWCAVKVLHMAPDNRLLCGWPDCRRFISWRWGWRTTEGPRWRCFRCRGVSQRCPEDEATAGQLCPARDYREVDGEPAREGAAGGEPIQQGPAGEESSRRGAVSGPTPPARGDR